MAQTRVGSAIHVTATETVAMTGGMEIVAIANNATTAATIEAGGVTIWAADSTKKVDQVQWRNNSDLTVTVTGGGSITIFTRVR